MNSNGEVINFIKSGYEICEKKELKDEVDRLRQENRKLTEMRREEGDYEE